MKYTTKVSRMVANRVNALLRKGYSQRHISMHMSLSAYTISAIANGNYEIVEKEEKALEQKEVFSWADYPGGVV